MSSGAVGFYEKCEDFMGFRCCLAGRIGGTIVFGALAIPLLPLIALIVLPIFAVKALIHSVECRSLYKRTFSPLTRGEFGRIKGQDYMRWDGKTVAKQATKLELEHIKIGQYFHGATSDTFIRDPSQGAPDSPFNTQADLDWLKREYAYRKKEAARDYDLKMVRAFSKALIPLIGLIWAINSETGSGDASDLTCRVCSSAGNPIRGQHWDREEALSYHKERLEAQLKKDSH